jgi:hypothetical protein
MRNTALENENTGQPLIPPLNILLFGLNLRAGTLLNHELPLFQGFRGH